MPAAQGFNIGQTFALAMQAYEAGRMAEAHGLTQRIQRAHPDFGGAHYLLGLIAMDQGQPKKAADHLARAIVISPGQPVLHAAMGRALEAAGNMAEASRHFQIVLSLDPHHAEAHFRLGRVLAKSAAKRDQAIDHCRRAVAGNPALAEAWNLLGTLLHQGGDTEAAAEPLRRALQLRPEWAVALNNYGVVLRDLGHLDQAVTVLEGAVEAKPGNGGYRANLAAALRLAGRLDQARAQAERATKATPRDAETWLELGLARKALGHDEGAAAAFERAVTVDPANVHAQFCLGEIRRAHGELARARTCYAKCLELDPADRHGAALGLALAEGAPPPDKAPEAYVRQLFDDYADCFDAALTGKLAYRGPALLDVALKRVLGDACGLDVLDAGCGTGLAAAMLRPRARRLEGFDLSPAMVAKAAERGLYDELREDELIRALTSRTATYDLITAADVLVYVGDLVPVMAAAAQALRPGGVFAFTAESTEEGFILGERHRYAHSATYVRHCAQVAGLTVEVLEQASSRRESGRDVPGLVVVLRKN